MEIKSKFKGEWKYYLIWVDEGSSSVEKGGECIFFSSLKDFSFSRFNKKSNLTKKKPHEFFFINRSFNNKTLLNEFDPKGNTLHYNFFALQTNST